MHQDLLYAAEVYAIVGAAIEVHRHLHSHYLEAVYQEALELELTARQIPFASQTPVGIHYKGQLLKKGYIADFLCYDAIIVEIKVLERLTSKEESQLLNYLHATQCRVGLLINFGTEGRLEWKRFIV